MSDEQPSPDFAALHEAESVAWDYRTAHHSVRAHPLEPLRPLLRSLGYPDAHTLGRMRHGEHVHYVGLVICRQRPGTASGVTFMTAEDETGFANILLWGSVFEQFSVLAKSQFFLGFSGELQIEDGVVHLIANKIWKPKLDAQLPETSSRDFH